MSTKSILAIVVVVASVCIYLASNWWERAFATIQSTELSPDGCIRVETYKPFWVLPGFLHRMPKSHRQNETYPLGTLWDYPIFARAYEASSDDLLGETVVYDGASAFGGMDWNNSKRSGRRRVLSDGFLLLDSDHCADKETLSRLQAYYEKERNAYPARMKEWDEYEREWREEERKQEEREHLLRLRAQ